MTKVSIAVLSAAEFEIAGGMIPELSDHFNYDDWLDSRYGMVMGLLVRRRRRGARES